VGDWKASAMLHPPLPASPVLLGDFDPFFRVNNSAPGPAIVTALNLKLYGVREDRASGRGSAIISTPDGQQRSFAIGEEIVPGVTLTAVGFDSVTISRGGTSEQLFLDQSQPAPGTVTPTPAAPAPMIVPTVTAPPSAAPSNPATDIQFQPRMNGPELTGIVVQPQGSGNAFRAAGLAPGDVIVSVNGERITSPAQAQALARQIGNSEATLIVERAGRTIPLRMRAGQ
jgi:general secretion pathway protein C